MIATLPIGLDNLAFKAEDRLFVSHNDQGYIFEVKADGTALTVIPGGMAASSGVAVLMQDGEETIWVASIFALNDLMHRAASQAALSSAMRSRSRLTAKIWC